MFTRADPRLALAVLVAASASFLFVLQGQIGFLYDEWAFLLYREGFNGGAFLNPHNDHIVVGAVAIYKGLLSVFGMESTRPFQAVSNLIFLTTCVLLFAYLRRRVGGWVALMGAALILFLGNAWIHLLWSFQLGLSGAIAAGLGGLLALDRDDRRGDLAAMALLSLSVLFSEAGIAFVAAALVQVVLGERPWRGRLYLAGVPVAVYAAWWLGWGHQAESGLSLHNVATSPAYVLDAASQGIASLLGLIIGGEAGDEPSEWGRILLVVAVAAALWRLRRLGAVPRGVWVALAAGLVFWLLAAFAQTDARPAYNQRIVVPSGIFILLIGAELVRGLRLERRALVAMGAVTVIAVANNAAAMSQGQNVMEGVSERTRAGLAMLEIAGELNPSYVLDVSLSSAWVQPIRTDSYLSAVERHGSPAYSPAEVAAAGEDAREEADEILGELLGPSLQPRPDGPGASGTPGSSRPGCRTVEAGGAPAELAPGSGTFLLDPGGTRPAARLGRFSEELPIELGALPGSWVVLSLPPDRSTVPWRLGLEGAGPVTVCSAPEPGGQP